MPTKNQIKYHIVDEEYDALWEGSAIAFIDDEGDKVYAVCYPDTTSGKWDVTHSEACRMVEALDEFSGYPE